MSLPETGPNPESVTAKVQIIVTPNEVFGASDAPSISGSGNRVWNHDGFNCSLRWPDTSLTPSLTVQQLITIGGSPTTIDLTSVAAAFSRYVDLTALYVLAAILTTRSGVIGQTNSGDVTVAPASSFPYPLFGTGNSIDMPPGRTLGFGDEAVALAAVSGSVNGITFSGTSGDIIGLQLIAGAATA